MIHDVTQPVDPVDYDESDRAIGLIPRKWKNCKISSLEVLRGIAADSQPCRLVWAEEGQMTGSIWQFNEKHDGYEPLLIDLNTARLVCQVYDGATQDETKTKVERMIASHRANFVRVAEFGWSHASFGR